VIVHDRLAPILAARDQFENREIEDAALDQIQILLYLKGIEADSLLEFREKPTACTAHWRKHAREAGLRDIRTLVRELNDRVRANSQITIQQEAGGLLRIELHHADFSVGNAIYLKQADAAKLT
jgi:hypothetical protein